MNVLIKSSVQLRYLKPQMIIALIVATEIYRNYQLNLVITSGDDSDKVHMANSKHNTGLALDFRTRDMNQTVKNSIVANLRACLNSEYDIVLEKDHIHIEYDPKSPET